MRASSQAITRTLGLERLDEGSYDLEISVRVPGRARARRQAVLNVVDDHLAAAAEVLERLPSRGHYVVSAPRVLRGTLLSPESMRGSRESEGGTEFAGASSAPLPRSNARARIRLGVPAVALALSAVAAPVKGQAVPEGDRLIQIEAAVKEGGSASLIDSVIPSLVGSELLGDALELFAGIVRSNAKSPEAWYALGLTRATLARSQAVAKEAPLQPAGAGFAVGAANALIRALELDPSLSQAAVALATHAAFDGWEVEAPQVMASERLAALRRVRIMSSAPPEVLLGCGVLEAEVGSLDSAAVYLAKYLDGGDQGVGRYRLARVRYRLGDSTGALDAYYSGAASSASVRTVELYRRNIAWVADSAELADYDSLRGTEREGWLRAFWGGRDAEAGRAEGERLLEHFRRYEYALEHFILRPSGPNRRAQRASGTAESTTPAAAALGEAGLASGATVREDGSNDNGAAAPATDGHRVGGAAGGSGELTSKWDNGTAGWLAGAATFFSHFVSSQQLLDHRGVIYMRHGPPDRRAISVGSGETWLYEIAPAPLMFHFAEAMFDGSSGNTILVAMPGSYEAMCGLDHELCLLGMQQAGTATWPARPLPVTQLRRQVERAQSWIRRGAATDTYTPRFAEPLEPVIQLFAMHGVRGEQRSGRVLAVFAVAGDQLEPRPASDGSGRSIYPLAIRIIASGPDGARHDVDTVRTFATAQPLGEGEYLLGSLELPVPPGRYSLHVRIEEGPAAKADPVHETGRRPPIEAERGALVELDGVHVPGPGAGVALSSIVLGREGSGLTWWSGSERVALNPLNTVPENGTVQLYYELSGLERGADYRTRLAVYRRGDEKRSALLTLSFTETAAESWSPTVRHLDIGRLSKGSYDLEVQVERTDGSDGPVARQVVLNVVKDD